jgi:hypothetical protein
MILASIGVGNGDDAFKAGAEAASDALASLPMKKANLMIVFGSVAFDQDRLLQGIAKISEDALIVGCSTAGEISSDGLCMSKTVVILALLSDQIEFYGSVGHHIGWNPKEAGRDVAGDIQYRSNGYVKTALMFLDVISGKGEEVLAGAIERFGRTFPLFGAAASDNELFFETYQYLNEKVFSGSVVGLGMSGNFTIGYGLAHGFLPIGVGRKVTKSEGTTLYELDGKPAVDIYKDYFGEEHVNELREGLLSGLAVAYPLGVTLPGKKSRVLRNPLFVDAKGAMTFSGSIPVDSDIRLMLSGKDEVFESATQAAKDAKMMLGAKKPKAVIVLNSVARKKLLAADADEEIRLIQQVMGRDVPIFGFVKKVK